MMSFEVTYKILCASEDVCDIVESDLIENNFQNVKRCDSLTCDLESKMHFETKEDALTKGTEFYKKYKRNVQEIVAVER